jgi:hypothetical protein
VAIHDSKIVHLDVTEKKRIGGKQRRPLHCKCRDA